MSPEQLDILRHSLGLDGNGHGLPYRHHFVTGMDSTDHPHCMALVEMGFMVRHLGNELTGGDDLFLVTDAGRAAATGATS